MKSIDPDIFPPGAHIRCNWLKVKDVLANYPLKLTKLYELINQRKIKSFVLKDHPSAIRGMRLVSRESLDLFFEMSAAQSEAEEQKPVALPEPPPEKLRSKRR
jgi:hypothetical protein